MMKGGVLMRLYDNRTEFYQYDTNQKLVCDSCKVGEEIHFSNSFYAEAAICLTYEDEGNVVVNVPNAFLRTSGEMIVYRVIIDDDGRSTIEKHVFNVNPRKRPSDYIYTEDDVLTWGELDRRLKVVEERKETDPMVPDWAKQPQKPKYTASEVGAQPANNNLVQLSNDSLVTMGGKTIDVSGNTKCAMGEYVGTGKYGVFEPSELTAFPDSANLLPFDFIPFVVDVYGERRCTFRLKNMGVSYLEPSKRNIRPFTPTMDGTIEDSWGEPQTTTHFAYGVKPVIYTWVTYDANNIYYAYRAKVPNAVFGSGLKAVVYIDKANDGVVGNRHGSDSEGDMIGWWVYNNTATGTGIWKDYSASWDGVYLKTDGRQMGSTFKWLNGVRVFEGELKIPRTSLPYVNEVIESGKGGRIPVRIGFYNNGEAYWSSTKDYAAYVPAVGEITYATPTVDGTIGNDWGSPQTVTKHSGSTAPILSTWVAVDDNNIYYAYRAEVSSVTFGSNLKAIVYIDKANDGNVGWSHGSGSTGDKIGWWYYPSVSDTGKWQDYSASWDGTYLKTDGRQMMSTVKKVNGTYVFEGELKIPRTSVPYIDAALKSDIEEKLPIRIGFVNGNTYDTDEYQAATIPACPIVHELAYEAKVTKDGESGVCPLENTLVHNKDGGASYLVWSMSNDATSKSSDLQLNKANATYHYVAWGVDVKDLYERNGWN